MRFLGFPPASSANAPFVWNNSKTRVSQLVDMCSAGYAFGTGWEKNPNALFADRRSFCPKFFRYGVELVHRLFLYKVLKHSTNVHIYPSFNEFRPSICIVTNARNVRCFEWCWLKDVHRISGNANAVVGYAVQNKKPKHIPHRIIFDKQQLYGCHLNAAIPRTVNLVHTA